jgi:hypothetical protein
MRKMWEVSRIHSMKKNDEWVEKWKGERYEEKYKFESTYNKAVSSVHINVNPRRSTHILYS